MLPKSLRITNKSDFYKIKKFGKVYHSLYFSVKFLPSNSPELAVIVSKKISNKSSIRNRIKRRTKAVIAGLKELPKLKVIVFPKLQVKNVAFPLLIEDFQKVLKNLL